MIEVERIEKIGRPVVLGVKNAKSFRKALETLIGQHSRRGNTELAFYTRGLLELYNKFHPKKVIYGEIRGWKGKSGIINIEKLPDKVIVTRFQKPNKDEEPKEVKIEITKGQLKSVISILSNYSIDDVIKTKDIAMHFSYIEGLRHNSWKEFFADRKHHNLLTNILGFLDSEGLIEYKGGRSKILSKELRLQSVL